MAISQPASETRTQLLRAAVKHFANSGYAATSVQMIVDEAKVSKPALYYHFKDKADLFQALVHEAHDERYRILRAAVEKETGIEAQLEAALAALFAYFRENRELMRISFASMFAAPGEVPEDIGTENRCRRNFDYVLSLIKTAQQRGELDAHFDCHELAYGFHGLVSFYVVGHVICAELTPDELTAKRIVELFLAGARPKGVPKDLGFRTSNQTETLID